MSGSKIENIKLDNIIKKTIEAINSSKKEIYDISENARKQCKKLEEELAELKVKVISLMNDVENLERELKLSKKKLMVVSQDFKTYSQEDVKKAYEKADNIRIELAVKREKEQNYLRRRNELEIRIRESYHAVEKAESLISNVGVALGYLTGDLLEITSQLDDLQQKKIFGIRIIKAQEEERQRVARDVHDGPAQSMSNVVLKAEICEKLIDVDLGKAKEELKDLKRIVRESLNDVRKIIYNLRPMSLDDLGLIPTLQRYTATFQEDFHIRVNFKTRGFDGEIKSVISLTVFRIIQEALANIKKHANAKTVGINIESINNNIKLNIMDDGKGFDTTKHKASEDINSGFGLMSMKERVLLLDGGLEIKSEIGKGTLLSITIPLNSNEEDING